MKKIVLVSVLIAGCMMLQGCIAALVGVVAGTAKVATDPRTTGIQVDDTTLDSRIGIKFKDEGNSFKGSRVVASAYDGNVLLIGQAKSQTVINRAVSIANRVEGVKKVYNQIRIGNMANAMTMTNDAWITTKVKSALIANNQTKARDIKVITEDGEVFLIGILTRKEGRAASSIASKVSSVKLVTTIFTYQD